jgi:hypothetical protein
MEARREGKEGRPKVCLKWSLVFEQTRYQKSLTSDHLLQTRTLDI